MSRKDDPCNSRSTQDPPPQQSVTSMPAVFDPLLGYLRLGLGAFALIWSLWTWSFVVCLVLSVGSCARNPMVLLFELQIIVPVILMNSPHSGCSGLLLCPFCLQISNWGLGIGSLLASASYLWPSALLATPP